MGRGQPLLIGFLYDYYNRDPGIGLAARLVLAQLANAVGFLSEACRAQAGLQPSSPRVPS